MAWKPIESASNEVQCASEQWWWWWNPGVSIFRWLCGWPEQGIDHPVNFDYDPWVGPCLYFWITKIMKNQCQKWCIVFVFNLHVYSSHGTEATAEEIEEDEHICRVLASFRFIRCNYKRYDAQEFFLYESLCPTLSSQKITVKPSFVLFIIIAFLGLANRTAEKTKPSALDLMLLFQESVRLKRLSAVATGKTASIRETLNQCIGEYNKQVGSHRASWLI